MTSPESPWGPDCGEAGCELVVDHFHVTQQAPNPPETPTQAQP